ncbi:MAG: RNA polymerase sigma factor [Gemmatimonadaceae bacterium]
MAESTLTETNPADSALITRWLDGDERAATFLVERHARSLSRFVASLGVRGDVEEVVQDTFVRAFGALDQFRAESSLRTWLFTIARNLVRDRIRSARVRRDTVPIEESDSVTEGDALDETVAEETAHRLRLAVHRLTPMQREVFTLRVSEGMSYREIAQVLGSTEGAARVHYFNAMRSVKEFIDD